MASVGPLASQSPAPSKTQSRPRCNFPPELWRDRFASISFDQDKLEWYDREAEKLKSMAKTKLMDTDIDVVERIIYIDLLCRLGISYHFLDEIERQLHKIFNVQPNLLEEKDYDSYSVGVVFRIFRQHGMKISCDIFSKFKDAQNGDFKESLADDPRGLLSLFEATHLRSHGEDILEELLAFTRSQLELLIQSNPELAEEITSSLTTPLHLGPPRLKVREFISLYEKFHEPRNDALLKFAKLDFNRVQLLHQQEIMSSFKWSKDLDLISKLPFARDRIIEFFFWSECVYFEPKYAHARAVYIKHANLMTFLDDMYDTYGKFEELPMFTDAMNRWDIRTMEMLPRDYMKHLYKAYMDTFDELEIHAATGEATMAVRMLRDYVAKQLQEFVRNYAQEAEWIHSGYMPSFEESLEMGIIAAGIRYMPAVAFIGMGELTVQAFKWLQNGPRLAEAASTIGRLQNELVSNKRDEEAGNTTYPYCSYKRNYKASDEETVKEFRRRISSEWKTMNEELMRESVKVPLEILMRIVNFARIFCVVYKDGDGITDVKYVESLIKTLYIDPIPL